MKKTNIVSISFFTLLFLGISALTEINRKTAQLHKELIGIEFRILELKNEAESPENQANMTIISKPGPKQAIAL